MALTTFNLRNQLQFGFGSFALMTYQQTDIGPVKKFFTIFLNRLSLEIISMLNKKFILKNIDYTVLSKTGSVKHNSDKLSFNFGLFHIDFSSDSLTQCHPD